MDALAASPLPYVLVGIAVFLAFPNARATYRGAVTTEKFLAFVRAQAEAGDFMRLRRVLENDPIAELMTLTRLWLELDLEPVVHAPSQGGYREAADVVPVAERARAELWPHVERRRNRLRAQLPWSAAALCLATAGVALGWGEGWVTAFGALAGLSAIYGGHGVWRLRRDLLVALDVLVTLPRPDRDDSTDETVRSTATGGRPQRLMVRGPDGIQREYGLQAGVMKIGSLQSADLRVSGEDVSRMHAIIEVRDDVVWVIDLGSAGGTWVGAERINKHEARPGDWVVIGEYLLEFA